MGADHMPRGGARVNSGPPPDPNALRRDRQSDRDGWTDLPAAGYDGPVPEWPLSSRIAVNDDDPTFRESVAKQESEHWQRVWRTPQAAVWVRLGWTHDVALYVRLLAMAELGDMKAVGETRQWSDRLGLNPAAMLRNRWRVARDQVGERREVRHSSTAPGQDMRDRLRALDGGGA